MNDENDKGGNNFVREAGGEGKNQKGGGRRNPCVPTLISTSILNHDRRKSSIKEV